MSDPLNKLMAHPFRGGILEPLLKFMEKLCRLQVKEYFKDNVANDIRGIRSVHIHLEEEGKCLNCYYYGARNYGSIGGYCLNTEMPCKTSLMSFEEYVETGYFDRGESWASHHPAFGLYRSR